MCTTVLFDGNILYILKRATPPPLVQTDRQLAIHGSQSKSGERVMSAKTGNMNSWRCGIETSHFWTPTFFAIVSFTLALMQVACEHFTPSQPQRSRHLCRRSFPLEPLKYLVYFASRRKIIFSLFIIKVWLILITIVNCVSQVNANTFYILLIDLSDFLK